jgi:hypothetical protein
MSWKLEPTLGLRTGLKWYTLLKPTVDLVIELTHNLALETASTGLDSWKNTLDLGTKLEVVSYLL